MASSEGLEVCATIMDKIFREIWAILKYKQVLTTVERRVYVRKCIIGGC